MRGHFWLFIVVLVSAAAYAETVIFEDDFENGLQGWTGNLDVFQPTEAYAKEGQKAIINPGTRNTVLMRSIGNLADAIYECWFYDLMGSVSETVCLVSKGRYASEDFLLIGTETQKSSTHYTYFLSPDVNSWGVVSVPRSQGWHKAQFVKKDSKTELYLDGTKITETTNNNNWNIVGVALNNWNSGGHDAAIFDNLKVFSDSVLNEPLQSNPAINEDKMETETESSQAETYNEKENQVYAQYLQESISRPQSGPFAEIKTYTEESQNVYSGGVQSAPNIPASDDEKIIKIEHLYKAESGSTSILFPILLVILSIITISGILVLIKTGQRNSNQGKISIDQIERLEKSMRKLVHKVLYEAVGKDYWKTNIPQDVKRQLQERVDGELKRHPYKKAKQYGSGEKMLEFCTIGSYKEIINSNWKFFEPVFRSKPQLEKRFDQLSEYRNKMMHSRSDEETRLITERDGEAAIIWFSKILDANGV